MGNKAKRFKWVTIKYRNGELIPDDIPSKISAYCAQWGAPSDFVIDNAVMKNIERTMHEQIAGRGSYDWNSRIDLANDVVQLPLIGFDDLDKTQRFVLDKQGLLLASDDDQDVSMTYHELREEIKRKILDWADISLLYSVGGVVDAIAL
jgi:hypothetical protein